MTKSRLAILFVVFVAASFFFIRLFGGSALRSRATTDPVYVFFDQERIEAERDKAIPVNIMVQSALPADQNKLSGGEMELSFDASTLEVVEELGNIADVVCEQNDNKLTEQVQFLVDQANGTVRLSRINPTKDSNELPPTRDSGMFCYTTLYFRFKDQNVLQASTGAIPTPTVSSTAAGTGGGAAGTGTGAGTGTTTGAGTGTTSGGSALVPTATPTATPTPIPGGSGTVSFNTAAGVCNFVGPSGAYACAFYPSRTSMTIAQITPTPTPTEEPMPTPPPPAVPSNCNMCDFDRDRQICRSDLDTLSRSCIFGGNPSACYANGVIIKGDCNKDGKIDAGDLSCCSLCAQVNQCLAEITPTSIPTATPTPTDAPSPTPYCHLASKGDACTCDGIIDIADFEPWRKQYVGEEPCSCADFNRDNKCSLIDFEIWRQNQQ